MNQGLSLKPVGKNEWVFSYPKSYDEAHDYFIGGLEELESGSFKKAVAKFKQTLKIFPQHIDALHHLSILADNDSEAKKLNNNALEIGQSVFPIKFDMQHDKLEWEWLENRPFLRAYEFKALFLLETDQDEALKCFLQMLKWNPNDNQGVREIVADIYVKDERWNDMLSLAEKYHSDVTPSIGYGEALSYFKKGNMEKATKKLKSCIKYTPLCARILLKERPKKPKSTMPGYITSGGPDQAYEFWKTQGQAKAWQDEKVKQWLKENI